MALPKLPDALKNKRIAILHAFFVPKGGGEKLIFDIRNYYQADLYTGALDKKIWDETKQNQDSFVKALYDPNYKFEYLHEDSKLPFWRKILRQANFLFHPKINQLKNYDLIIYSGNIGIVPARLKASKVKQVVYCHTPPRPFTDQLKSVLKSRPFWMRPFIEVFARLVVAQYRSDLLLMDAIITNSNNTHDRLLKYVGLESEVVFPAANTGRFKNLEQGDYFISYARIEPLKRIPLIIDAFAQMPDKKLIICSTGPLNNWVKEQISSRGLNNIIFEGLVSDERLQELVGGCLAGIYIPIDEDAGISQIEIMAAGKPVIGVNEGGLRETVIDGQTGVLIPANPTVTDLINAVQDMTPDKARQMEQACLEQAKKYDAGVFFSKLNTILADLW
jgi:glycosyltransferase involved in cell wall biosynthesis